MPCLPRIDQAEVELECSSIEVHAEKIDVSEASRPRARVILHLCDVACPVPCLSTQTLYNMVIVIPV